MQVILTGGRELEQIDDFIHFGRIFIKDGEMGGEPLRCANADGNGKLFMWPIAKNKCMRKVTIMACTV